MPKECKQITGVHCIFNSRPSLSKRKNMSPLRNTHPSYHTRSNSLPSRSHPLISQIDEHLSRFRSSQATSTSSSISQKLNGLQDLHDSIDKMLQLPLTQQTLAQEQNQKWTNEMLDRSLRLLDVCSTAKDALLQLKESAQELQSILRRRRGCETGLPSEVKKYLTSRKAVKKAVCKALGDLKDMEHKCTFPSFIKDDESVVTVSILREAEAVTITIFDSFLSFISGSKACTSSNWSLVSKLMHLKRVACEGEEAYINEFAKVDAALNSLIGCKTSNAANILQIENVQSELQNLELCIQDLEEGLECLCRRLIKTRVALLNILSH